MAGRRANPMSEQHRHKLYVPWELDDAGLSPSAFRIYAHLTRRAGGKDEAFPSIDDIKRVCGCRKRTAIAAIREMEERHMIEVSRKWGCANRYKLVTNPSLLKASTSIPNGTS